MRVCRRRNLLAGSLLSFGLLLDVVLGAALLSLADIVLVLILGLGRLVTGDTGEGAAGGADDAVGNTAREVGNLTLSLLLPTLKVLLAA